MTRIRFMDGPQIMFRSPISDPQSKAPYSKASKWAGYGFGKSGILAAAELDEPALHGLPPIAPRRDRNAGAAPGHFPVRQRYTPFLFASRAEQCQNSCALRPGPAWASRSSRSIARRGLRNALNSLRLAMRSP